MLELTSSQRMLILLQTLVILLKSRVFLSSQAACWCLYIIYYLMCCHTYRRANLGLILLSLFLVFESQYCNDLWCRCTEIKEWKCHKVLLLWTENLNLWLSCLCFDVISAFSSCSNPTPTQDFPKRFVASVFINISFRSREMRNYWFDCR